MKATLTALTCIVLLTRIVAVISEECGGCWFGDNCSYKCRCSRGRCNNGMCIANDVCQAGWFGPACQYIDLAYNAIYDPEMVVDNSGSTCAGKTDLTNVTLMFSQPFIFTWLRLRFASSKQPKVTVLFNTSFGSISCGNRIDLNIGNKLDISCHLDQKVEVLVLTGEVGGLCSVKVSGGRNLALKQQTWQSSSNVDILNDTDSNNTTFPADKAVDGDTSVDFYDGSTCTQALRDSDDLVSWNLTFSRAVLVDRYVLFLPNDTWDSQWGLTLSAFNITGHTVFTHDVTSARFQPVYTIVHRAHHVSSISISSEFEILELCEVEVYGDSECDVGYFGRDCEQQCNCADQLPCTAHTGTCPHGCAPGYWGDRCNSVCKTSNYGPDCLSNCSMFCNLSTSAARTCSSSTGYCLFGCVSGFSPPKCSTTCPPGTYGPTCSFLCSRACKAHIDQNETTCDAATGACLKGCLSGFIGVNCSTECPVGSYGPECTQRCSKACYIPSGDNGSYCDFINGTCMYGCQNGYTGPQCFTKCENGRYGLNCLMTCSAGCAYPVNEDAPFCDSVNGTCLNGCNSGYGGLNCDIRLSTTISSIAVGRIAAFVIVSVSVLFVMVTAAAFLIRRHNDDSDSGEDS